MDKSERLRLGEVRAAFRAVGECRELGHDPDAWPAHLLTRLPGLTGAHMLVVGEMVFRGPRPVPVRMAHTGWPFARAMEYWSNWCYQDDAPDHPGMVAFAARPRPRGTATRQELVPDRDWDVSPYVNEVLRPFGIDEGLVSSVALPGGRDHMLVCSRPTGEREFSPRERNLVQLLHAELARHLGRGLATSVDPAAGLTPRQREVLGCLLDGDPEKRIARKFGVTPATLHGYVKRVYRVFGVRSRAELLAYFLRRYRR
ncbi:MAG: helix-turn-helix transcriptional regulator [Gemmataceae bacterium]